MFCYAKRSLGPRKTTCVRMRGREALDRKLFCSMAVSVFVASSWVSLKAGPPSGAIFTTVATAAR